jgi:capsid protein
MIDLDRLSTDPMSRIDPQVRAGIRFNGAARRSPIRFARSIRATSFTDALPEVVGGAAPQAVGPLQVIHLKEQTAPEQSRGVPEMAAALREMRMSHSLRGINLQHAVMQAVFAARSPPNCRARPCSSSSAAANDARAGSAAITNYAQGYLGSIGKYVGKAAA